MIDNAFQKTMVTWAQGKTSFHKILAMCDSLKGIGKGKTIAILAPSYLMHKIDYQKLINNPNIHTMTMNNGYLMPGTEKCEYYLPLTTINKTNSMNQNKKYIEWVQKFPGLVMHGMNYDDGTSGICPYPLASEKEIKDIILKCHKTKFSIWHHAWGHHVKKRGVPGMLETPFFDQWTPRRIPWAHCGALSGFAIPLSMALGYSKIYIVGMGYKYVVNGYHNPTSIKDQSKTAADSWLQFASKRFPNQAKCAEENGILLKVGPKPILEPELSKFFKTFDSIDEIA